MRNKRISEEVKAVIKAALLTIYDGNVNNKSFKIKNIEKRS
ncbi:MULTISPECIES: hypothetical protein [unclassified Halanaerobium]|nr:MULTISPECIES: hypothetical protein [unclassified Halanaerobium]RCW49677.1 hypothetical protein DFR78_1058 [Halanaerobium sp. MA284_MarDTE_T2]RCW88362.1 hypothetical protein DER71_1048 [Halanaerobium sp. DL-01]